MCGIVGMCGIPNASLKTFYALTQIQHRGRAAVGILSYDEAGQHVVRGPGLAKMVFREVDFGLRLPGRSALGHNLQSLTRVIRNDDGIQPLADASAICPVAVTFNGNIENAAELRSALQDKGAIFASRSQAEIFLHLIKRSKEPRFLDRLADCLKQLAGAYSVVVLTNNVLYAARDPGGYRPLHAARLDGGWMASSETVAFDLFGVPRDEVSEIQPGTAVNLSDGEVVRFSEPQPSLFCSFELGYHAHPCSEADGRSVGEVRKMAGRILARNHPVPGAETVIGVPDSAVFHGQGYAEEAGLPVALGLMRSHYTRPFSAPGEKEMFELARLKFAAYRPDIVGKSVVVVDDSVIRGSAIRRIITLLKDFGARKIHVRIATPLVVSSCRWGMSYPPADQLIANKMTVAEMMKEFGADSLDFLSLDEWKSVLGDQTEQRHCYACFNCKHPTEP